MNSKLYVGNMSFKTTEADLRDAFGQFGSITDVYIASDRETGRPRGFAFVTFSTDTESKLAAECSIVCWRNVSASTEPGYSIA